MGKNTETRQVTETKDPSTCGRKTDGITKFKCDICVNGILYELENHDGYFDYYQKKCHKCNGEGIVDWVSNLCY